MKHAHTPTGPDISPVMTGIGLLAYCRPGFESECAQELTTDAQARDVPGFARTERGSGFVEYAFAPAVAGQARGDSSEFAWQALIFSRQILCVLGRAEHMARTDRLAALMPIIDQSAHRW